jgi:hypothetical protein
LSAIPPENGEPADGISGTRLQIRHTVVSMCAVVNAGVKAVGPLCVAGALTANLLAWPAPAEADPGATLLNDFGIGNNGPISAAIAQVAVAICPMLVKPGSSLAQNAVSDKGQLASTIAGGVAGLAIQTQCPQFMTSLANGDFSVLSNAASMLGMSAPAANPLSLPGIGTSSTVSNPLAAPALSAFGGPVG